MRKTISFHLEIIATLKSNGYGIAKRPLRNRKGRLSDMKLLMVVPLSQMR